MYQSNFKEFPRWRKLDWYFFLAAGVLLFAGAAQSFAAGPAEKEAAKPAAAVEKTESPLLYATIKDYESATGKSMGKLNEAPALEAKVTAG